MNEQEIRVEILKIQDKYYTPTSKIAEATNTHRSLLSKMLNDNFGKPMYKNVLDKLETWLLIRI